MDVSRRFQLRGEVNVVSITFLSTEVIGDRCTCTRLAEWEVVSIFRGFTFKRVIAIHFCGGCV